MPVLTLLRKMDNGYGKVEYIQQNELELDQIHEYFQESLQYIDHIFDFSKPFPTIESVISFLDNNWEEIANGEIKTGLSENENFNRFIENCNPNGYGNDVDNLVISSQGEVIFDRIGWFLLLSINSEGDWCKIDNFNRVVPSDGYFGHGDVSWNLVGLCS